MKPDFQFVQVSQDKSNEIGSTEVENKQICDLATASIYCTCKYLEGMIYCTYCKIELLYCGSHIQ